ncbi:hypothetical protein BH09ACT4_BH09ACT4_02380 [soil metagenome]
MTCRYCGSELPADAMFCGECGRAVLVESLVGANSVGDDSPEATGDVYARFAPSLEQDMGATAVGADEAAVVAAHDVAAALHCPQCDSAVDDADVFCGECGFVLKAVIPGAGDTAIVADAETPWPFAAQEDSPEDSPESASPESESLSRKDTTMQPEDVQTENEQDELVPAAGRSRTIPDPFPWGVDITDDGEDIEATRIVSGTGGGDRFVLQFSTGESVTVSGAGLIGRNPAAQPGEYVDQLVSIFDVGKSVSKTHLEFGQEGGRFWVSDRYSTNGSVVRQPEAESRRCEPGRRYFVVRGTRIDVGEQFFVVS